MFTESAFIDWATAGAERGDLRVGPGDDAAVLADGTLVTVDAIVEGMHFQPGTPSDQIAAKALGCAVSDICAMGGRAEVVFVVAQMPPGTDGEALAGALRKTATALDVVLGGGDTVAAPPGALSLSVTVLGHVVDGEPWLRSGAQPGDRLVVSGPLGGSRAARHLSVRPRCDLVSRLRATRAIVHAAMDLSDGLGRDLPRLCEASSVGARIDVACLPIHADVEAQRDATAAALGDGEDFELLLALPADVARPGGLIDIGEVVATPDVVLVRNGHDEPWPSTGFEHGF